MAESYARFAGDVHKQYVWGLGYIDAPILRDRETDGGSAGLDESLYYTQDGNFNVTALVNPAGQVVERYSYDPYGRAIVRNGAENVDADTVNDPATEWDADPDNASDVDNRILYCGYRFDSETGLYHVRHRYLHPSLGRWITQDPAGYVDGMGLFEYVSGNVGTMVDPWGLMWTIEGMLYGGPGGGAAPGASWEGYGATKGPTIVGGPIETASRTFNVLTHRGRRQWVARDSEVYMEERQLAEIEWYGGTQEDHSVPCWRVVLVKCDMAVRIKYSTLGRRYTFQNITVEAVASTKKKVFGAINDTLFIASLYPNPYTEAASKISWVAEKAIDAAGARDEVLKVEKDPQKRYAWVLEKTKPNADPRNQYDGAVKSDFEVLSWRRNRDRYDYSEVIREELTYMKAWRLYRSKNRSLRAKYKNRIEGKRWIDR
jgi:RHS repeat-associated protein